MLGEPALARTQCAKSMLAELPDVLLGVVASQLQQQWCVSGLMALAGTSMQLHTSPAVRAVCSDPETGQIARRLATFFAKAGKAEGELWKATKICCPLKGWNAGEISSAHRYASLRIRIFVPA